MLSDEVFDRTGIPARVKTISKNLYAFTVAGLTMLGILASFAAATFTTHLQLSGWGLLGFIAITFVIALGGTMLATASDNPLVSLLGYALVAVPFGLMLGPVVSQYTAASVVRVFLITTLVVAVLAVVGAVIPDNLEGFGSYLLVALMVLIGGMFLVPLAGFLGIDVGGAMTLLDWAGVVIFSGLVVYDWNRAMRLPRTMDNAVDSALAVYLDWFNIFIRLLALTGDSDD